MTVRRRSRQYVELMAFEPPNQLKPNRKPKDSGTERGGALIVASYQGARWQMDGPIARIIIAVLALLDKGKGP